MGFAFCLNIFAFEINLQHVVYSCGLINGNYAQIFYVFICYFFNKFMSNPDIHLFHIALFAESSVRCYSGNWALMINLNVHWHCVYALQFVVSVCILH